MPESRDDRTGPRVRDVIAWPVDATPLELRAARGLGAVVAVILGGLGQDAGAVGLAPLGTAVTDRLPADPDEPLGLEPAALSGTAPWLPPPWALPQQLHTDRNHAWIEPGLPSSRRTVPLGQLTVTAGRCRSRSRRPRHPSAAWDLDLTGPRADLRISGPWLTLGWLAHLGGWPPPPPGP